MIHQLCRSILGPPASSRSRREAGKDAGGLRPCVLLQSNRSETASVHGLLALAVLAPGAPETEDLRQSPPGSVVVQVGRGHLVAPLVLSARPPVVRLHLPLGAQGQGGQAGARVAEQVDVVVERRLVICDEQQIGAPGVQHLLAEVALAAGACPSSVLNTRCKVDWQPRLSSHKESALCHCVARAQALRLARQAARPAELATPGDLPEPTPSPLRWPGDAPRL
jgi:hypothetical protein